MKISSFVYKIIMVFFMGLLFILVSLFFFSQQADCRIAWGQSNYEIEDFEVELTPQHHVYSASEKAYVVDITYKGQSFYDYSIFYENEIYDKSENPPINVGEYDVEIRVNGTDIKWDAELSIRKKSINIEFAGASAYQYNGMEFSRSISAIGGIGGDDLGLSFRYIGEIYSSLAVDEKPIMADVYSIEITLSNENYEIVEYTGPDPGFLEIRKGSITAKAEDLTINFGEIPEFSVTVFGFIETESIEDITLPKVVFDEEEPGVYTVIPSGGRAANYTFTYKTGILTINKLKANAITKDGENSVNISGVFHPNFILDFKKIIDTDEQYNKGLEAISDRKMAVYMDKVIYAFDTSESEGYFSTSSRFQIKIENIKLDKLFGYKILVVDDLGIVHEITKYNYSQDSISFSSDVLGTFFIVEKQLRTYMILGIFVGLIVIIIAFVLLTKLKYYMEKKQIEQEIKEKRKKKQEYRWD